MSFFLVCLLSKLVLAHETWHLNNVLVRGQSLLHLHCLYLCLLFAGLCVTLLSRIIMRVMVAHLRDARHTVHQAWYVHLDLVLECFQVFVVLGRKLELTQPTGELLTEVALVKVFL